MTPEQNIFFENASTEIFESMLEKIQILSDENSPKMALLVMANVGQLASGMALSFYIKTGDREESLHAHKLVCDSIWNSAQNYAAQRERSK